MRHLPDSRLHASLTEFIGREIALCVCGGALDFDTDLNGYVIEICTRCHTRRPMEPIVSRAISEEPAELIDPIKCLDCPEMIGGNADNRGPRRLRCNDCTKARQQRMSRDWNLSLIHI